MGKVKDAILSLAIGSSYSNKINQRDRFFDAIIHLSRSDSYEIIFFPYEISSVTKMYELDKNFCSSIHDKNTLQILRDKLYGVGLMVSKKEKRKLIFLSNISYYFALTNICDAAGVSVNRKDLENNFYDLGYYMNGGSSEMSSEIDAFTIVDAIKDRTERLLKNQK